MDDVLQIAQMISIGLILTGLVVKYPGEPSRSSSFVYA
jgi:hypothetical protein